MSSEEVCRFFLTGSCRHGAACRFAHPGPGDGDEDVIVNGARDVDDDDDDESDAWVRRGRVETVRASRDGRVERVRAR